MVSIPSNETSGASQTTTGVTFSTLEDSASKLQTWFRDGLVEELVRRGFEYKPDTLDDINLVLNVTDIENPATFRRKSQGTFAIAIVEVPGEPDDFIRACYPVLVRSLSQVALCLVDRDDEVDAHFMTMEQGHYVVSKTADRSEEDFFAEVHERIAPLATARYVINNRYDRDLPQDLWSGDELTSQLIEAGKRLDSLNLLPTPWPIQDYLSERELRHVKHLFGIGGLSYGNLSVRKDAETFWMSASGVNKGQLQEIGRDILLVKDFDPEDYSMVLSVPPDVQPRRVSVDAIEHFMIYREHPDVNAIVHVHAWMDNIKSTHINFPCGTQELAIAVADLVRQEDDPSRAVIGLKNHGLTLTGRSLDDIFERLESRVIPQVPMS